MISYSFLESIAYIVIAWQVNLNNFFDTFLKEYNKKKLNIPVDKCRHSYYIKIIIFFLNRKISILFDK